jgi:endonuclease/exonuclease/phosphatase family metal-dependent hydrolase
MTFRTLRSTMLMGCVLGVIGCAAEIPAEPEGGPTEPADPAIREDCADGAGPCVLSGVAVSAPGEAEGGGLAGVLPTQYPFWVLQLNLCNSGFASCYQGGKSVPEGSTVIQNNWPDVVTLNEVCSNDVPTLASTLANVYSGGTVVWAFKAAVDRRTGGDYKCKNGQSYGIGLLAHIPGTYSGYSTYSGVYSSQDTSSNEERVWVCVAATGNYYACTTHLASTSGSVALNQCKYLMNTAIPSVRSSAGGYRPTVMGGDLNLKYGGWPYDAQSCVPSGYFRKGDGDVQHIMATTDFTFSSSKKISMTYTDHPGWFVALTAP